MKKWLVMAAVVLAAGIFAAQSVIGVLNYHARVIRATHEYQPYTRTSYDGRYDLNTVRHDTETGVFAGFSITDRQTGALVYRCPDMYRVMDLHAIEWMGDAYDVYVDSTDVGAYLYRHSEDGWARTGSEHHLLSAQ